MWIREVSLAAAVLVIPFVNHLFHQSNIPETVLRILSLRHSSTSPSAVRGPGPGLGARC